MAFFSEIINRINNNNFSGKYFVNPDVRDVSDENTRDASAAIIILAVRIIIACALFVADVLLGLKSPWDAVLPAVAALLCGYDVILRAVMGLLKKEYFNTSLLMTIAAIAAFAAGAYSGGAAIIIIFRIGGVVISTIIFAGRRHVADPELAVPAGFDISSGQRRIDSFAKIFTMAATALAIVLALLFPLLAGAELIPIIKKSVNILILATPSAIILSVPLTYFYASFGAKRMGILFKSPETIDKIAKTKLVMFDKTGILTTGKFRVADLKPAHCDARLLMKIAAHAELYSNHPIGRAITEAYSGKINPDIIRGFKEHAGLGVTVTIDDMRVAVGNKAFIEKFGVDFEPGSGADLTVYVIAEGKFAGSIMLMDTLRKDALDAVSGLGLVDDRQVVLVSGDNRSITSRLAQSLGISEYYAECSADDKIRYTEDLKKRVTSRGSVVFVGDAVTDALPLAAADVGIAVGVPGSPADTLSADVIITDDSPIKVISAIDYAKSAKLIIRQNVFFAAGIKLLLLLFSAIFNIPMWIIIIADTLAALLTAVNAFRAFKPNGIRRG